MPHFLQQCTKEELQIFMWDTVNETTLQHFRYEFTVTYNPKYIESIDYANSLTTYVQDDIERYMHRNTTQYDYAFNYVVEYQKNGYPHLHGTMFSLFRFTPQSLNNLEKSLGRKYGKSAVYSTGHIDKIHTNDHFTGTWSEYIEKEQVPRHFISIYQPF